MKSTVFVHEKEKVVDLKHLKTFLVLTGFCWTDVLTCGDVFLSVVFQQIATQIAVLIAKVARLDCPRQWPELIPVLLESVKGQDGLQQHRALLTFYHVTKTLASKRLAQDKRLFQDVSLSYRLLLSFPFYCLFLICDWS